MSIRTIRFRFQKKTFQQICEEEKERNVELLQMKEVTANRLAGHYRGRRREAFYAVKNRAIDQLVKVGATYADELSVKNVPLVRLRLTGGGVLRANFFDLSERAQSIVLHQLENRTQMRNGDRERSRSALKVRERLRKRGLTGRTAGRRN